MSAWKAPSNPGGKEKNDSTAPPHDGDEAARDDYMVACTDYLKRQLLVYQNWPQRKYDETGYLDEVVFRDQNA